MQRQDGAYTISIWSSQRNCYHYNDAFQKHKAMAIPNSLILLFESCKEIHSHHTHTHIYIYILVGRVFAYGLEDMDSIPGRVIPKTLKMVLDASLLNTQQYKERSSAPLHLGVVAIEKGAFWLSLTTVANYIPNTSMWAVHRTSQFLSRV